MNTAKGTTVLTDQPTIVTICGSTRFKAEIEKADRNLTLQGCIVLSMGVFGHSGDTVTDAEKVMLDALHRRKIDMSDGIFVVNPGGYIGESTRDEIEYAQKAGKQVWFAVDLDKQALTSRSKSIGGEPR